MVGIMGLSRFRDRFSIVALTVLPRSLSHATPFAYSLPRLTPHPSPLTLSAHRIFSNSWGTAGENGYDTNAHNVDLFMRNHPDALVLFAAGNTGNFTTTRNRVYAPATAKNCVAVGAASNDHESWQAISDSTNVMPADAVGMDGVAFFSSPGPTEDNRLKPDVIAPGYFIQSALGTNTSTEYFCDIHGLSGTLPLPHASLSCFSPPHQVMSSASACTVPVSVPLRCFSCHCFFPGLSCFFCVDSLCL